MTIRCAVLLMVSLCIPAFAGEASPEKVAAALPEIDKYTERVMAKTGVPGIGIAVVYRDQVVHLKGFGVREVGRPAAIDSETVFQIASVSKPLSSTVLAAIVGEGTIGWDDRIIDHDPGFRMYDPWVTREVTIRDMLCHRSGLPDHAGDHLEDMGYNREKILFRLRYEKPAYSFRTQEVYTNFGYTEAGVAGAMAAKTTWEDLAAKKLFAPLGMTASSYRFADYAAAKNRAHLHVRIDGKWKAKFIREPDAQAPAGGASSNVKDMAQWLRLQLANGRHNGKPLISAKALGETHLPQIVSHVPANPSIERAGFYGLGWNVNYDDLGRVRLSHSGAFGSGAATVVAMLPVESLGIVVLSNGMPIGVPEAIAATFLDLATTGKPEKDWFNFVTPIFEALLKPDYGTEVDHTKPPANATPALDSKSYVGKYRNEYYGDLEVVEKNGALELRLGPKLTPYSMRHYDRDVFAYQPKGENAFGPSGVTFQVGPTGMATRVLIENLDKNNQGTFRREENVSK